VITPSGLNSGIALWQGPVVYAAAQYVIDRAGANVATGTFSSQGLRMSLPHDALPIGLWPCRTPVVFYLGNRGYLWMKPLTAKHGQRLGRILNRAAFDSHGRLVQVEGMTIHYLGGPTVTPRGLPTKGWRIERLAPSPRQQSLFLAEVEKPGCTGASGSTGRLYVISPRGNRQLATYDSCGNPPLAVWSQDGSKIFWTTYRSGPVVTRLHISDSAGRHTRILTSIKRNVPYALWSPDGRTIAYTSQGDLAQAADINSATRAAHALTHIRWKPTPPPPSHPVQRSSAGRQTETPSSSSGLSQTPDAPPSRQQQPTAVPLTPSSSSSRRSHESLRGHSGTLAQASVGISCGSGGRVVRPWWSELAWWRQDRRPVCV
jgi:hypothetical protein